MPWRSLYALMRPLIRLHAGLTRGLTLGVRAVVLDEAGRVLLVEHTYVPGWWLPGGGVERGETARDAIAKELREEAGIEPTAAPVLVSVHSNDAAYPGDHVLVFRVEAWRRTGAAPQAKEIRSAEFFPADALPEGTTEATRRRLAEALGGAAADAMW